MTTDPPAGPVVAPPQSERLWQIDALRGLMLVLMALTHLPTRFASPTGQPFGYVSAAEGFVLLSGFMAGMVYTERRRRKGELAMREAFWQRAWKIYLCQAALLLFLFTVVSLIGVLRDQAAITNMVAFYFEHPLTALLAGLLLLYSPPLLDILPLYVLFMVISPLLLLHAFQNGWTRVIAGSVVLWVAAQFQLGHVLYDGLVAWTGHRGPVVPFEQTGSFNVLAWQFLWVLGLWLGASRVIGPPAQPTAFPRWFVRAAVVVAAVGLVWRHAVGQVPFPHDPGWAAMLDKWQLGPLRLLDVLALLTLTMHFAPWLGAHLPRLRALETLGTASLPVFCAHLVLALLLLAWLGEAGADRSWLIDTGALAGSFAVLYGVALVSRRLDDKAAQVRARLQASRQARRMPSPTPATRPGRPTSPLAAERHVTADDRQ